MSLQQLYKMILESSGFVVIGTANNGQEAVGMYKSFQDKPQIILMDHRMPIKNGIEATKEILRLNPTNNSRIIFASADKSVKDLALSIGASSFLEKPFSFVDLTKEIEKVLKTSQYTVFPRF